MQTSARENTKYSRNGTILKIGHHANNQRNNVVVKSISACCLELRYLKLRNKPSSRLKRAAHKRKVLVVSEVSKIFNYI